MVIDTLVPAGKGGRVGGGSGSHCSRGPRISALLSAGILAFKVLVPSGFGAAVWIGAEPGRVGSALRIPPHSWPATSWDRVRGAFLSYDAALRQEREQVAMILYVVAAECLTNPFEPWKTQRLTARFVEFFDELMPDFLDEMVQHGNFEQAFNILRGTRAPRTLASQAA